MPKPLNHQLLIKLEDSFYNIVDKLSQGNPGARSVLMSLLKKGEEIDPENLLSGLGEMLNLDCRGIYGPDIWVLFKDCCRSDITDVITVLKALRLGVYSERQLWNDIDNGTEIDVEFLSVEVKKALVNFNKNII